MLERVMVRVPVRPSASVCGPPSGRPVAVKVAPFQPSPNESIIVRVHIAPGLMMAVPVKGAPPPREAPSSHANVHEISVG